MINFEEELKIYRAISSIYGDILFKYDIKTDIMHVIGGHKNNAGNGYDINNFMGGVQNNGTDALFECVSAWFKEAYRQGFPEFFDEKISVQTRSGGKCYYRAIGKKEYDDDWNEQGIIGKLISLGEENEFGNYIDNGNNSAEFAVNEIVAEESIQTVINDDVGREDGARAVEIIEEALDTLANTGNIGIAVTSILEKIGNMFDLDCVTIQEYAQDGNSSSPCIQWYDEANRIVFDKIARLPFDNFPKAEWNDESMIIVDDLSGYTGNNTIVNKMRDIDIKSVVICKYAEKGQDIGWISFENHHSVCRWTEEEIITFRLVAKFISVYLLDMKSYLELLKKQEREKTHDIVTGLPKYELFGKKAVTYINKCEDNGLAIVCFGINNLEKINKIYGRILGDEILKIFAEECEKIEDRFIIGCRMNADIFVALINQFDSRGNKISTAMIDHMKAGFERICREKCPEADVSVYSGITFLPGHVDHLENYIGKARMAMENAREEGISCGFAY